MQGEKITPTSKESLIQEVLWATTTVMKNSKKLKINVDKDLSELQIHDIASINVVEAETDKKRTTKVLPQNTNKVQDNSTSEPEIKKRKTGRPSVSDKKKDMLVKQRSSKRSIKGRNSKGQTATDPLIFDGPPSPVNVTEQKTPAAIVITESLSCIPSTHKDQAETIVNVPKVNETPETNGTMLPLKKPLTETVGKARKRVGGEGRTASLQRIMLELPNLCDPNVFSDILMKTYGGRLEAYKVFECLTTSDLKEAIMKRFTSSELMALIQKSDSSAGMFLTTASTEAILLEVQSREELGTSDKLLNMLLENIPNQLSNKTKKALNSEKVIETVLNIASVNAIVKKVNMRPDLKSSEKLLNILLQNLPEKISDETKKNLVQVLIEKFNTTELVDISHEAIKKSVDKIQKPEVL